MIFLFVLIETASTWKYDIWGNLNLCAWNTITQTGHKNTLTLSSLIWELCFPPIGGKTQVLFNSIRILFSKLNTFKFHFMCPKYLILEFKYPLHSRESSFSFVIALPREKWDTAAECFQSGTLCHMSVSKERSTIITWRQVLLVSHHLHPTARCWLYLSLGLGHWQVQLCCWNWNVKCRNTC